MTYTPVATMRPFGVMLDEIARMEKAYLRGLAENVWKYDAGDPPPAKDAAGAITLLEASRAYTVSAWDRLTAEVLLTRRTDPFFFGADRRPYDWLFYCLENEIHHRGQAYTYLRQLGVEPPAFYER